MFFFHVEVYIISTVSLWCVRVCVYFFNFRIYLVLYKLFSYNKCLGGSMNNLKHNEKVNELKSLGASILQGLRSLSGIELIELWVTICSALALGAIQVWHSGLTRRVFIEAIWIVYTTHLSLHYNCKHYRDRSSVKIQNFPPPTKRWGLEVI